MSVNNILLVASSLAIVIIGINAIRHMSAQTRHSIRLAWVLLSTGGMGTVIVTVFPQLGAKCHGFDWYDWMIPIGFVVLFLADQRRRTRNVTPAGPSGPHMPQNRSPS